MTEQDAKACHLYTEYKVRSFMEVYAFSGHHYLYCHEAAALDSKRKKEKYLEMSRLRDFRNTMAAQQILTLNDIRAKFNVKGKTSLKPAHISQLRGF